MVENTKSKVNYIESKKGNLVLPILFLLFVILISAGAFAYNEYLQKQKADFDTEILRMQQVIKELNDKPEIQVYSLLENNK
jgi:predicted negative regulator of RcsB-dependent stress response